MIETHNKKIRRLESEIISLKQTVENMMIVISQLESRFGLGMSITKQIFDTKSKTSGSINDCFSIGSDAVLEEEKKNQLMLNPDKCWCINNKSRTGALGLVKSLNSGEFISKYDY